MRSGASGHSDADRWAPLQKGYLRLTCASWQYSSTFCLTSAAADVSADFVRAAAVGLAALPFERRSIRCGSRLSDVTATCVAAKNTSNTGGLESCVHHQMPHACRAVAVFQRVPTEYLRPAQRIPCCIQVLLCFGSSSSCFVPQRGGAGTRGNATGEKAGRHHAEAQECKHMH